MKKTILLILFLTAFFLYTSNVAAQPTNQKPVGIHDGVNSLACGTSGWVFDPDSQETSTFIKIYIDGVVGTGKLIGTYSADVLRADVNKAYAITGNHGFNLTFDRTVPAEAVLFDGLPHPIYVYGVDTTGISSNNELLGNSPQIITCSKELAMGDATITNGSLMLQTSGAFGGGIVMLRKGTFSYMNQTGDRGVGFQTAWQNSNSGECFNPTHHGSRSDGSGPTTTTKILSFDTSSDSVSVQVNPAYWLRPGEQSIYCNFNSSWQNTNGTALNTTLNSDSILSQQFILNPESYSNVVEIDGAIKFGYTDTTPRPLNYVLVEQPVLVLVSAFTQAFRYQLETDTLMSAAEPSEKYMHLNYPAVLATADGSQAVAMYSSQVPPDGWTLNGKENIYVGYQMHDHRELYGIWSINARVLYYPPKAEISANDILAMRTYVVTGTLAEVKATLHELYLDHPNLPLDCLPKSFSGSVPEIQDCSTSAPQKTGDLNNDNKVDIFDYNIIVSEFGSKYAITDYNSLVENFGK